MLKIKHDLKNQRVFVKIGNLGKYTRQSIRQGFFMLARDLKKTTSQEILKKDKTGQLYIIRTKSGRRRRHRASAPGQTHANITGKLRRSLSWKVGGYKTLEFGYGVTGSAPLYGKFLEFGTRRMAARPSLQNSIKSTSRNAEKYVGNQFKKLTR